jgi:hypothetical protein
MPNKQSSRTQTKRRNKSAAPPTWALSNTEVDLKSYYAQDGNFQLYHNVPARYYNLPNLFDSIVNGTNYHGRIGNRIHVKDVEILMVLNNKTDRPNVSYRFVLCAAPTAANTDAASELFAYGGFTGLHIPTNSVLLHDQVFPQNQGSGMDNNITPNKERSFTHRVVVPINKPIVYNTDQSCTTRLIGWVTAYDAYGTLTTDNIASIAQTTWRVNFTDT